MGKRGSFPGGEAVGA